MYLFYTSVIHVGCQIHELASQYIIRWFKLFHVSLLFGSSSDFKSKGKIRKLYSDDTCEPLLILYLLVLLYWPMLVFAGLQFLR